MPNLVLEHALRHALFLWLDQVRIQTGGEITADLLRTFTFKGEPVRLLSAARGIHSPKLLGDERAALTLLTGPPDAGNPPLYDDSEASDREYFLYRYQRNGVDAFDNQMVRRAMHHGLRLVYFRALEKGRYEVFYPIAITHDDPENQTFHLSVDPDAAVLPGRPAAIDVAAARRYATRAAKVRLHQAVFRQQVLKAYVESCAVCRIKHRVLLDAAHITPDSAAHATAEVTNGISLCKIHHAAYDAHLLGITPDYRVAINARLLEEVDGPVLQYGLKERHNEIIKLPSKVQLRPDKDRLQERYRQFLELG